MARDGFRPAWWLPGPHAQTIGARLLRSRTGIELRRERLELPDGDFVDLDWVVPDQTAPLVLVLHGLEGSARSKYVLELHRQLAATGLASVGMNFRSCSGEPNRLPRLYHSGETEDLRHVLNLLRERYPGRALGAAGFSLGGNVLLKYLGEEGTRARGVLDAAAAVSVPFDLAAGASWIERGFSRVYLGFLVGKLRRKVRAKQRLLEARVDLDRVVRARTFWEFDNAGTAPLHGFRDAADYYRRSSSVGYLKAIRVPSLLVHSLDDPFLGAEGAARALRIAEQSPHLDVALTELGGHVGFVSGSPWRPVFWAERTVAEWLGQRCREARRHRGTEADRT